MSLRVVDDGPAAPVTEPYRRVLVASFLDEAGRRAVLRAARLPLVRGAQVFVFHAVTPWRRDREVARSEALRVLGRLAEEGTAATRTAGNREVRFTPVLGDGWPAGEIIRAAWQERCELIVVGPPATRADGTPRATLLRVLRQAELPLLVVRNEPAQRYDRVLCAVDRAVTAIDTVALARRVAAGALRRLTLFHAFHFPFEAWVGPDDGEREREAHAYLLALAREVPADVPVTRTWVSRGDPGAQAVRTARAERADLLVVGTRGRSWLTRALARSTTEWLLASAPADLAVARAHRFAVERRG